MENSSQEVQFGSLIDLSPEELEGAMASTVWQSTPRPEAASPKIDGLCKAFEVLAAQIEKRDGDMVKRLNEVTERLETIESSRTPDAGRRSTVSFVGFPSTNEGPEEDELMRTIDEIESRVRAPKTPEAAIKPKVKPSSFDGRSSWEDYLAHFSLVAELNHWDSVTKATYLAVSLVGSAREVLGDLSTDQRKDYAALTAALTTRFGTENRTEIYRASLRSRTKQKDESLPELAQSLRRLTRCAYPQAQAEMKESIARDQFIDALVDLDTKWKVKQGRPSTLNEALEIAMELEAFQIANRRTTPQTRTVQSSESTTDQQDLAKQLADLREQMKQFQNRYNGGREGCFTCGALDHFRRDCPTAPQKQQQRRGNRRPHQPSGQQQQQSQLQKDQHNHQTSQRPQPLPRQHLPTNQVPSGNANLPGSRA